MRLLLALAAGLVMTSAASAAMIPAPIAILQGLDKISARTSRIEAPIGAKVQFGTLSIVVRDCEQSPPDASPENAAFIQIYETPVGAETKRLFSGWMFSSSPALSELEHPVYDVTLLSCKAPSAPIPAPPPVAPPSPKAKTPR